MSRKSEGSAFRSLQWRLVGALLSLTFACASHAAAINFPSVPPYIQSTSVPPNFMLMIDDSGSMNSIIWDTGYDPGTTYPNWGFNSTNTTVLYSTIPNSGIIGYFLIIFPIYHNCTNGYKFGFYNGNYKCLKLNDPRGNGNTLYSGNYLNYLFNTYGSNNSDTDISSTIPNDYRMNVARNTATSLVSNPANNANIRFCLSTLALTDGANILAGCDLLNTTTKLNAFTSQINGLNASTYTPLGEASYEITRYFRGMSSFYKSNTTYTSPLANSYRCQSNYVVYITDGYPTQDTKFPTTTAQEPNLTNPATGTSLPDWDGLHPATQQSQFPANMPPYSDGFQSSCSSCGPTDEGYTLYLDDLALFGYDLDMKTSGNDPAGGSYNDPAFGKQNLKTFTVGLATNNQMLVDAANYGHGQNFQANNQDQLNAALQATLSTVQAQNGSSTAATANVGTLTTDSYLYLASFRSSEWTGDVKAYPISTGGATGCSSVVGALCDPTSFQTQVDSDYHSATGYTNRKVFSYNTTSKSGIAFAYANLNTAQKAVMDTSPDAPYPTDNLGNLRVNYLLGDPSHEVTAGSFRKRAHLLGDIIDSSPFYVGPPSSDYGYNNYSSFRSSYSTRVPVVYAGGNDGMLHAFQASGSQLGKELFAYIPSQVFGTTSSPDLTTLTSTSYSHHYMVDGPVTVGDAYSSDWGSPGWKSVLVGGLGRGGKAVYALDVTSPTSFSASNVMWEFSSSDDPDLGYTLGQPAIVRLPDGDWAAVVSSGYDNANSTGKSAIFILLLKHNKASSWTLGSDYYKIVLPDPNNLFSSANPNGLAAPAVIDYNNDGYADTIYVGDLGGELWKIDISDTNPTKWAVAFNGTPLFNAKTSGGTRLPITERPEIGYNLLTPSQPSNAVVYFGTGKYLETTDSTTTTLQTFFGIFDNYSWRANGPNPAITRNNLQQQVITDNGSTRTATSNEVNTSTQYGWYVDLPDSGERSVYDPTLFNGNIVFTTLIPSPTAVDPCVSSNIFGWVMELDARNGGEISNQPLFDTNNDGVYDTTAAGFKIGGAGSGIALDLGNNSAALYTGNGTGTPITQKNTVNTGRLTWREFTP